MPNPFFANPAEPLASLLPGARYCMVSIVLPLHISLRCWGMRPPRLRPRGDARAPTGRGRAPGLPAIAPVGCGWLWVSAGSIGGEPSCRQRGFGSGIRSSAKVTVFNASVRWISLDLSTINPRLSTGQHLLSAGMCCI